MPTRRRLALAAFVVMLAGLGMLAVPQIRHPLKRGVARVADWYRRRERRARPKEEPYLQGLSASQVGYGPAMRKQFTSPRRFARFAIEEAGTGRVVWEGQAPVRSVPTTLLGNVREVWIGDFSAFQAPGRFRVRADNGLVSRSFAVGPAVFDAPLRAAQRWFYYQRAFTDVRQPFAEGPWVHPSDADKAPSGIEGGWHDAGDFSIYSAPMTDTLFWMLLTASDFAPTGDDTNVPESGNGVPDLLDELRWGLRWLLSVQDAGGGFQNTTCQQHYGGYGTNTPQSVPPYQHGEVGTLATARAVGNLGFAAAVFRPVDPAFADRCLAAARKGMAYLDAHPGENTDGPTCPAARHDGDAEVGRQVRMFASAGMLLATGERRFRDDFAALYTAPQYDPRWLFLDGQASLIYLRAPAADPAWVEKIRKQLHFNAAQARSEGDKHPFQWATRYHWGSLGAAFTRAGLSSARMCLDDPQGAVGDCEQAMASLHYAFGRNSLRFCYVSGLPGVEHGMTEGFHHWLAALGATPRDFPGIIAGGPSLYPEPGDQSFPHARPRAIWGYWGDPAMLRDGRTPIDGRYTDNDSYSTNEPSIGWQAEALYLLHLARWLAHGPSAAPR